MVKSNIYYATIAGEIKTVRANNKEMAHDYFLKYDLSISYSDVHLLPVNQTSSFDITSGSTPEHDSSIKPSHNENK